MQKTDKILLSVAGFNILVVFYKSFNPKISEVFKVDFTNSIQGFVKKRTNKTIDFLIEFKDKPINSKLNSSLIKRYKLTTYYQDYIWFKTIFENVLYILCSQNKALIIHSSSVAYKNHGYLFLGKSGAGKSTIAKLLSPEFTQLSDDTTIIKKKGRFYLLYQHPFLERNSHITRSSKPFKLSEVYILRKNQDFKVEPIKNIDLTFDLLLKQLTVTDKNIVKNLVSFTTSFSSISYLYFPKNKSKIVKSFKKYILK